MPRKDRNTLEGREHNREYQKRWYAKNKKTQCSRVKEREKRISKKIAEYKLSLKCEKCGEGHPSCLDFHHKNPLDKDCSIGNVVNRGWGWKRIEEEMEKCEVLCANCHRKEHWA